jgi:NAD(P)-dependent dehydrogenase (short-subunit alcohol dehydrogenase family)
MLCCRWDTSESIILTISGSGGKERNPGGACKMEMEENKFPRSDLKGKVAIVTGAGQGIGEWIALGLADAGADVLIADLKAQSAEKTSKKITEMGRRSLFFEVDIGDIDGVTKMIEYACKELGDLDILINNAGINVHKKALDITEEDFDKIIKVNSKGVYFCSQAAARVMIPKRSGKIINISSVTAFLVRSGVPNSVYALTKAGIVMLTKALAEEWAQYNINVNAIAPGYFATPMVADRLTDPEVNKRIISSTPLGRVGEARDIIGAAVFLASDASDYITGQTISIDGGRTVL